MERDEGKLHWTEFQSTKQCMSLEENTGMWDGERLKTQGAFFSGTGRREIAIQERPLTT